MKNSAGTTIDGFNGNGQLFVGRATAGSAIFSLITSTSSGVGAIFQGSASQSADLIQLQNSTSSVLSGFNSSGQYYLQSGSFTSTIAQAALSQSQTITIPASSATTDTVCLQTLANCASGSGFIVNGTSLQSAANFFISNGGATNATTAILQQSASQTGDLLEFRDSSSFVIASFNASANLTLGRANSNQGKLIFQNNSNANTITLLTANGTAAGTLTLPGETGTLCSTGSVCTGYAPATGSANYIQNGTGAQTANFNIQSAATGSVTATIQGVASQTADVLDVYNNLSVKDVYVTAAGIFNAVNSTNLIGNNTLSAGGAGNVVLKLKGTTGQTGDLQEATDVNGDVLSKFDANGNQVSYGTNETYNKLAVPIITSPSTTGTNFYYAVTSTNAQGETVISSVLAMNANTSVINWTQINGATGYKIYRNTSNSFTSGSLLLTTITNGTTVTYTDSGSATSAGLPPTAPTGNTMTIQGWASQTADLQDWVDYSGAVIAKVSNAGKLTAVGGTFSGNVIATATSGVTLTVTGVSGSDIADFKVSGGANGFKIDQFGDVTANGSGNFNGANANNGNTAENVNLTNTNTAATPVTQHALSVNIVGTNNANVGENVIDGIFLNNVAAKTNNTFNGLNFGTGYTTLIQSANFTVSGGGNTTITSASNTATALQVLNSGSTAALVVSTNNVSGTYNAANAILDVADDSGTGRSINAAGTINASGADYAEYFYQQTPGSLQPGQVVCLAGSQVAAACGSSGAGSIIVGAVSSNPGFVGNDLYNAADPGKTALVGMLGQIPVNFSTANGAIAVGDAVTYSTTTPGAIVKATSAGQILGFALDSSASSSNGQITVLVRPQAYNPTDGSSLQGSDPTFNSVTVNGAMNAQSINVGGLAQAGSLRVTGDATIGGNLSVAGGLTVAGMTNVMDITVGGHIITSGAAPTVQINANAGSNASVTITGNDTSGTISFTSGDPAKAATQTTAAVIAPLSGDEATISFAKLYGGTPHIIITANDGKSAPMQVYPDAQAPGGFSFALGQLPAPNTTYTFEYFIVQ